MRKWIAQLAEYPRVRAALLPTPVHELEWLGALATSRVFCKRDDLTGFGFGGNKTRKLEFLMGDALQTRANTLIGVGANQSNFCRVVAAFGAAHDVETHLVLGGRKPAQPTGNLRLDHLLGAQCHHVPSAHWPDWTSAAKRLASRLQAQGCRVYAMPIGGSTPIGALGYVQGFAEIMNDEDALGERFDVILHASSSAGTQAGLVVGKTLARWPGRIIGISVAKKQKVFAAEVLSLARQTAALFNATVNARDVIVEDRYIGPGYAKPTEAGREAVEMCAQQGGMFLDYVYTGKAAAALLDYLRRGKFPHRSRILFLHTGGTAELFA